MEKIETFECPKCGLKAWTTGTKLNSIITCVCGTEMDNTTKGVK